MTLRYEVSVENLARHTLRIDLHVPASGGPGPVDLVLPVWTPGAYQVQPWARSVRDVEARDPAGTRWPVGKVDRSRWRVARTGAEDLTVSYLLYAHDLLSDGIDATEEHIYLNAAASLVYVEGRLREPVELVLHPPAGWRVITELEEVGRSPPRYRAADYDELADSPLDMGHPVELVVRPRGIPHRIVVCGAGNYVAHRLEEDHRKFVEATYRLFGELPVPRYTFFYHLTDRWDGGLEHLRSTSIVAAGTTFRPRKEYDGFLEVAAHEYFHLFNVKRIRPASLGPFDYTRENYSRMLWAMEGTTDYYTFLLLRRGGVWSVPKFLEDLATRWKRYREMPGRLHESLEEASFDTWVDEQGRSEEGRNLCVNYYLKGALVSLALDLHLRERSRGERSLDDVLRHLWTAFGKKGVGIPEGGWQREAEKATGLELGPFFDRFVRGVEELDLAPYLRHAGLSLEAQEEEGEPGDPVEPKGHLGVEFRREGDRPRLTVVLEDSPARRAGLSVGDELLALDGFRVDHGTVGTLLRKFPPGTTVEVAFYRRGVLRTLPVTLGKAPPASYKIRADPGATPEARKTFESWLEAPWTALTPGGSTPSSG